MFVSVCVCVCVAEDEPVRLTGVCVFVRGRKRVCEYVCECMYTCVTELVLENCSEFDLRVCVCE